MQMLRIFCKLWIYHNLSRTALLPSGSYFCALVLQSFATVLFPLDRQAVTKTAENTRPCQPIEGETVDITRLQVPPSWVASISTYPKGCLFFCQSILPKTGKAPGFPTKTGTQGSFCSLCDYLHPIWSIPLPGGVSGKHIAQIQLLTNVSAECGGSLAGQLFETPGEIKLVAEAQLRADLTQGQMGIHHQLGGSVNKLTIHILAYG